MQVSASVRPNLGDAILLIKLKKNIALRTVLISEVSYDNLFLKRKLEVFVLKKKSPNTLIE